MAKDSESHRSAGYGTSVGRNANPFASQLTTLVALALLFGDENETDETEASPDKKRGTR